MDYRIIKYQIVRLSLSTIHKKYLILFWLFLSGSTALGYEILWIRYLSLVLGNTIYSLSWTTSMFMCGLGLGSVLALKVIQSSERLNIRLYGILEIVMALLASFSLGFLYLFPELIHSFLSDKGGIAQGLVAAFFVLPASSLMGVTLPIILQIKKEVVTSEDIYTSNTFGGAAGVLLFGFILLRLLGYDNLIILIPIINLLIGSSAIILSSTFSAEKRLSKGGSIVVSNGISRGLFISGLSGFLILGLQVAWFRSLEIILGDRSYIPSVILFIVLIILALSSWTTTYTSKLFKDGRVLIFACFGFLVSILLSELFLPDAYFVYRSFSRVTYAKVCYIIFSFIIPLFFLGQIFPFILSTINTSMRRGKEGALLVAVNTFGGAIGSLFCSYFLLESFGLKSIFILNAIAVMGVLLLVRSIHLSKVWTAICLTLVICYGAIQKSDVQIAEAEKIIYQREHVEGHFTLLKRNQKLEMYNGNYRIVSPFGSENVEHAQNGLAFFPAMYHPDPKKILTMGLGYGITTSSFLMLHPDFVDTVEIMPSIFDITHYFKSKNRGWYLDKRVNKVRDDARRFLYLSNTKYDIISSNIASPHSTAGSFFLSKEYFEQVKVHLAPGGVYSQLVWGANLTEIIHTLKKVFPFIEAIPGYEETDLIIVASSSPLNVSHPYSSFEKNWPKYLSNTPFDEVKALGANILERELNTVPRFIISDSKTDLAFSFSDNMGLFWVHN